MINQLEKRAIELAAETHERYSASDLLMNGYVPHHQTFRKPVEGYEHLQICYKQVGQQFKFASITDFRGNDE